MAGMKLLISAALIPVAASGALEVEACDAYDCLDDVSFVQRQLELGMASTSGHQDSNKMLENDKFGPVFWLHVPKTGSSFETIIAHHVCNDSIPEDVTVKEPDDFFRSWKHHCANKLFGRFARGHDPLPRTVKRKHVVVMMREPKQRILSGYYAFPERLHDCPRLRDKYHCQIGGSCDGDLLEGGNHVTNPDVISPREYAMCVKHCAVDMLTGSQCGNEPPWSDMLIGDPEDPVRVAQAVSVIEKVGFVGLTEEWLLAVCLWHAKFGGRILPSELNNVRPNVLDHGSEHDKSLLDDFVPVAENRVYSVAKVRFWKEVKFHGLNKQECANKVQQLFMGVNLTTALFEQA